MKRILLVAACIVATAGALAQGTVNFNNRVLASGINAPVTDPSGAPCTAALYVAQLYAGAAETSLAPMGVAVPFRSTLPGYFSSASAVTITGINPGGAAYVQVRAWAIASGATYEAAVAANGAAGMSAVLGLTKTGDPTSNPPGTPVDLVGLQGFQLTGGGGPIPEPTTIALGALAAGALLLFRRK